MKKVNRYICFFLVIVLLFAHPVCATDAGTYSSSFFWQYGASIHKVSSNAFEVCFSVISAGEKMDYIGVSEIKIQRSTDNTNWTTVATYTYTNFPQMVVEDDYSHDGYIGYAGPSGYYYRAKVTFWAKNSTGQGHLYQTTDVLHLP